MDSFKERAERGWKSGDVTFMKALVKPLYIGYLQALDLTQKPFSVSENGPFENNLGLLKLIFHTNLYNGA